MQREIVVLACVVASLSGCAGRGFNHDKMESRAQSSNPVYSSASLSVEETKNQNPQMHLPIKLAIAPPLDFARSNMKIIQKAFDEEKANYPLPLFLEYLEQGQNSSFGATRNLNLPLPLGNSAYVWRNDSEALILLDRNQNITTNLYNFYHEMGHLWSDLQSGRKVSEIDREIDAENWCLENLIKHGMDDIARGAVRRMKAMLDNGEANEKYSKVYSIITQGRWSFLLSSE